MKEALILAGGFGSRLIERVPDKPKCLAEVCGRPFLFYLINHLRMQGIERFVFSLGFRSKQVTEYLKTEFRTLNYSYVNEKEPLGTGGAIKLGLSKCFSPNVLVCNGDSLFRVDLAKLFEKHKSKKSDCTILTKMMHNFDRYGTILKNEEDKVIGFKEKKHYSKGLINTGIYLLNKKSFLGQKLPDRFSFETDFLEKGGDSLKIYAHRESGYFIDIGIPADYEKANYHFKSLDLDLEKIKKNWTLFLDRDGVINHEIIGGYVCSKEDFKFIQGVTEAIAILKKRFHLIFIVTNQRAVEKKIISKNTLSSIHKHMLTEIKSSGGRIDDIFCCTNKDDKNNNRKPNPGLAAKAKKKYPNINFKKSIMIGDKLSDMKFAKNSGMFSVYVGKQAIKNYFRKEVDLRFNSLLDFAKEIEKIFRK